MNISGVGVVGAGLVGGSKEYMKNINYYLMHSITKALSNILYTSMYIQKKFFKLYLVLCKCRLPE